jgi:gamma-glutamylcyclotransferase (GGCT)/AIG2-like uncharacterized protein YtfP
VPLMFLNGGGMRGGSLHRYLLGTPLLRPARTAPKYRFYAVGGEFPAITPGEPGHSVVGELYDLPLEILRDSLMPREPRELELGLIELEDGTAALATVLRRPYEQVAELIDISELGDWRAYQAGQR